MTDARVSKMFCWYFHVAGVPLCLRTNRGPPLYSTEFWKFLQCRGMNYVVSSPHYSQSSDHNKATVKFIKCLILKNAHNGNIVCVSLNFKSPPLHQPALPPRYCMANPSVFVSQLTQSPSPKTAVAEVPLVLNKLTIGQQIRIQYSMSYHRVKIGVVMRCEKSREYEVSTQQKSLVAESSSSSSVLSQW